MEWVSIIDTSRLNIHIKAAKISVISFKNQTPSTVCAAQSMLHWVHSPKDSFWQIAQQTEVTFLILDTVKPEQTFRGETHHFIRILILFHFGHHTCH